jgi:hypothetical protein
VLKRVIIFGTGYTGEVNEEEEEEEEEENDC